MDDLFHLFVLKHVLHMLIRFWLYSFNWGQKLNKIVFMSGFEWSSSFSEGFGVEEAFVTETWSQFEL